MCEPCRERVCQRDVVSGKVVFVGAPYDGQEREKKGATA